MDRAGLDVSGCPIPHDSARILLERLVAPSAIALRVRHLASQEIFTHSSNPLFMVGWCSGNVGPSSFLLPEFFQSKLTRGTRFIPIEHAPRRLGHLQTSRQRISGEDNPVPLRPRCQRAKCRDYDQQKHDEQRRR